MVNLLPEKEKIKILREYQTRLLVIVLFLIFCLLIVFAVFVSPSFFLTNTKQQTLSHQFSQIKTSTPFQTLPSSMTSSVSDINFALDVLDSSTMFSPKKILDLILSDKKSSISIKSISIFQKSQDLVEVSVSGISSDRESLLGFSRKLQSEKTFENVVLPISDLAKGTDISFTINFSVKI